MNCPFCNGVMNILDTPEGTKYQCRGNGPLIRKKDWPNGCPYRSDKLTQTQISQLIVALIDLEME